MGPQATIIEDRSRHVALEVLVEGEGTDVVLVPSAMRGALDFGFLQGTLADAGYRSLALNPRGVGNSKGSIDSITLRDLAEDIALVVEELCSDSAHLVGHALGNTLVRATASFRPDVVRTVTAMPCSGHDLEKQPVAPEVGAAVGRCPDKTLSVDERLEALRIAFFAPGNDPRPWLEGWWPDSRGIAQALRRTDPSEWWRAGSFPLLVIQPLDDAMASPEEGRQVAGALGERATYVEVPDCGHAILPEQPGVIARHIIRFLGDHR
jgi:pimeloyl-ACP methyl ester carboxylesterase